ncbi:GntR family transcriptional regulator [Fodinicurvata sp. EGI_FJ10296]|uniref:GntR family transcriptional regulator n=1 Tax=Fodinicurvata sp. EGI_FJ10296 TaxID=3231908 RepID=UPI00345451A5
MLDRSSQPPDLSGAPTFGRGHLKDLAYQRLRAAVLHCELAPGTFVTEARLAAWLGLGKAPVRNALASLVNTGLVQAHARRGYRVAPISDREIADIFDLRRRLEPTLGDVSLSRSDLERLQRLDDIIAATGGAGDAATRWTAYQADREALHLLATASGNSLLVRRLTEIWDLCDRAVAWVETTGGHAMGLEPRGNLIDALACGDRETATALIARRVATLADRMRTGLTRMTVADPSATPGRYPETKPATGRQGTNTNREAFSEEQGRKRDE